MITTTMKRLIAAIGMVMCALTFGFAQEATKVSTDTAAKAVVDPVLITVDSVKKDMDAGVKVTILDSRGGLQAEMVKGSTQVTLDKADAWAAGDGSKLAKNAMIVTYCGCGAEQGSKALAAKLEQLGYTNVHALKGGIGAWKAAGLPVESPK
ncbi:MAG TPA: rhodanese-like domain-containing protein [Blastocatellia bacterium]|nr:rhodanese-like domain-containing protein [Blastocatellia bacterium]